MYKYYIISSFFFFYWVFILLLQFIRSKLTTIGYSPFIEAFMKTRLPELMVDDQFCYFTLIIYLLNRLQTCGARLNLFLECEKSFLNLNLWKCGMLDSHFTVIVETNLFSLVYPWHQLCYSLDVWQPFWSLLRKDCSCAFSPHLWLSSLLLIMVSVMKVILRHLCWTSQMNFLFVIY